MDLHGFPGFRIGLGNGKLAEAVHSLQVASASLKGAFCSGALWALAEAVVGAGRYGRLRSFLLLWQLGRQDGSVT